MAAAPFLARLAKCVMTFSPGAFSVPCRKCGVDAVDSIRLRRMVLRMRMGDSSASYFKAVMFYLLELILTLHKSMRV